MDDVKALTEDANAVERGQGDLAERILDAVQRGDSLRTIERTFHVGRRRINALLRSDAARRRRRLEEQRSLSETTLACDRLDAIVRDLWDRMEATRAKGEFVPIAVYEALMATTREQLELVGAVPAVSRRRTAPPRD